MLKAGYVCLVKSSDPDHYYCYVIRRHRANFNRQLNDVRLLNMVVIVIN